MVRKIFVILVMLSQFTLAQTLQEKVINKTLEYEGDEIYKNSKRGIERATLKAYNKKYKTNWKIESLTHEQAFQILADEYWNNRLNYLHPKVAQFTFDFAMNSAPSKAYQSMHKEFGLKPQSTLSLELVAEMNEVGHKVALNKLYNARLGYLKSLSTWELYGRGWNARLDDLIK